MWFDMSPLECFPAGLHRKLAGHAQLGPRPTVPLRCYERSGSQSALPDPRTLDDPFIRRIQDGPDVLVGHHRVREGGAPAPDLASSNRGTRRCHADHCTSVRSQWQGYGAKRVTPWSPGRMRAVRLTDLVDFSIGCI